MVWRKVRRQMREMTGEGATGQLLSSYSQVSLRPSIQLPRNGKRFTYKWEGWGTNHPQTQPLAPPLSCQNISCLLTHRRSNREHPPSSSLLPSPQVDALKSSPVITHSHVLPSFLALLTCLAPGHKHRLCTNSMQRSNASSTALGKSGIHRHV